MKLRDAIKIEQRFQNSINLKLDLDNPVKLKEYIPTVASIHILKQYIEMFANGNKMRSNLMIGPYGKGKSHLVLVLLGILHKVDGVEDVFANIESVDSELARECRDLYKKQGKYLPVIVSFGRESLTQSYLIGLTHALRENHLDKVVLKTDYSEAVRQIGVWRRDYPETYLQFTTRCNDIKEFIGKLNRGHKKTLLDFQKYYSEVSAGAIFNPMVSMDVMQIFESVNDALCREYGYEGMVIVFDEFSKFIEGQEKVQISGDMKLVQDMCELANHSKENKIYNIFIAHKSIKEYGNNLPKEIINAFTGVEGRLNEIYFVTGTKNNYEIIKNVITKKEGFDAYKQDQKMENIKADNYSLHCFSSVFEHQEFGTDIVEGCFPLLPLTAYMLLKVSERIGQNERSLFTFLAKKEEHTLMSLIEEKDGDFPYIGVEVIYDYFENIFRKDVMNQKFHQEWSKANRALTQVISKDGRKFIKALALIGMFEGNGEIVADDRFLRCSLGWNTDEYKEVRDTLIENQIIQWRNKTNTYMFKNSLSVNLKEDIDNVIQSKLAKVSVGEILRGITNLNYELPKRYNQDYAMTRYFEYIFMDIKDFEGMNSTEELFRNRFSDGKIIAVVDRKGNQQEIVRNKVETLKDSRIVAIYPDRPFQLDEQMQQYRGIHYLLGEPEYLEEEQGIKEELSLLEEDVVFEINRQIEKLFLPEAGDCQVYACHTESDKDRDPRVFNHLLSSICNHYYHEMPRVNSELINRRKITSQIRKARDKIVTALLTRESMDQFATGTSAESAIYRATLMNPEIDGGNGTSIRGVMEAIHTFIKKAESNKVSFLTIYDVLLGEGYGMRGGIIPIYLALAIAGLDSTPVVYVGRKELMVNCDVLNMINQKPEEYQLYVEKGTTAKSDYLKGLENLFGVSKVKGVNKLDRMAQLVEQCKAWHRSLPAFTVFNGFDKAPELRNLSETLTKAELNPREFLFEILPSILKENNFDKLLHRAAKAKKTMDECYPNLVKRVVSQTANLLHGDQSDNLVAVLKEWYMTYALSMENVVADTMTTDFIKYIHNISTNDVENVMNGICKIVSGFYMQDWRNQSETEFIKNLSILIKKIETNQNSEVEDNDSRMFSFVNSEGNLVKKYLTNCEEDSTMNFLTSSILEAADDFGESLEKDQKVAALLDAIEQIINS